MLSTHSLLKKEYHIVSWEEAKANNAYWQVVASAYSEEKSGNGVAQFIREPLDDTYLTHAKIINTGNVLDLDFTDPEFIRNIFKAFRLKFITLHQMTKAWTIYEGRKISGNNIKQYEFFTVNGPYEPQEILYASDTHIEEFKNRLNTLPASERTYFCFNFSKVSEIAFLIQSIAKNLKNQNTFIGNWENIFIKYVNRLPIEKSLQEKLLQAIATKNCNLLFSFLVHYEQTESRQLQYQHRHLYLAAINKKEYNLDRESAGLLIQIAQLNEQLPGIQISPDYDPKNPHSPLLCLIVPTTSAHIELQQALHGEHTTDPYFMVGPASLNLMRSLDETPTSHGRTRPSRPVEITHPDIIATEAAHNAHVHPFFLMWHDLFHCWRNSSNIYKPLIRHLRTLIANEIHYEQSNIIWKLTDMDLTLHLVLEAMKDDNLHSSTKKTTVMKKAALISILRKAGGEDFWEDPQNKAIKLLIIIDMIKNAGLWAELMLITPENQFSLYTPQLAQTLVDIKNLITQESEHSTIYYILRYKLKSLPTSELLCQELESKGFDEILHWSRNSGLFFNKYTDKKHNKAIDQMDSTELYIRLRIQSIKLKPNKSTTYPNLSIFKLTKTLTSDFEALIHKYFDSLLLKFDEVKLAKFDALVKVLTALHTPEALTAIDKALTDKNVTSGWWSQETYQLLLKAKQQLAQQLPQVNLKNLS